MSRFRLVAVVGGDAAVGGGGGGGGSAGQLSLSVTAKRDSLVPGIELLGEILRSPAFGSDDFEQMKLRSTSGMNEMLNDPAALASSQLARSLSLYSKGDVRYIPTIQESIEDVKNVSLDQVVEIYSKQLSSATSRSESLAILNLKQSFPRSKRS